MICKVFEKLVNNRLVDHLEKSELFSDFRYGFRSSRSTEDLVTIVCDRTCRVVNSSGITSAIAIDISKAFDRVWHADIHRKVLWNFRSDVWSYFVFSQL